MKDLDVDSLWFYFTYILFVSTYRSNFGYHELTKGFQRGKEDEGGGGRGKEERGRGRGEEGKG